ncbi:hypothetical protein FQN50_005530 [Emmonsiellopsis sp. PD_5]|nr:hypothetical protein FQN50_005530 [Emmonsiellopsis sp. PD_5]
MPPPPASPSTSPSKQSHHQPPPSTASTKSHPPISILSSPAAQTYAHLHPFLLLALFGLRFRALVDDTTATLTNSLPLLAALQAVYAVLCLPAAAGSGTGGEAGSTSGSASARGGKIGARKRGGAAGGDADGKRGRVIPAILSLTLPLVLGTPLLATLLVLFGAPVTTHIPHTILCAAHMALLAGTSLVYVHGTDGGVWGEIWGVARATDVVWGGTVGVGLGAWLGAVPIPLDWDRPWQAYPITIITGAYIGYVVGCIAGRTPLLYGKRIQFAAPEVEVGGEGGVGDEKENDGVEKDQK